MITLGNTTYTDYYPFGSEMPGRKFVSGDHYKHGYQGQFTEKDEEVNWEAFELRNWDGRLARWTSTDPANQFWSPYLGMGNNPISGIDPDGGLFGKWRAQWYAKRHGGEAFQYKGNWQVRGPGKVAFNADGSYNAANSTGAWHKSFGSQGLGLGKFVGASIEFEIAYPRLLTKNLDIPNGIGIEAGFLYDETNGFNLF